MRLTLCAIWCMVRSQAIERDEDFMSTKLFLALAFLLTFEAQASLASVDGKAGAATYKVNGEEFYHGSCRVEIEGQLVTILHDMADAPVAEFEVMGKSVHSRSGVWRKYPEDDSLSLCGLIGRARGIEQRLEINEEFVEIRTSYNCGSLGFGVKQEIATRCELN